MAFAELAGRHAEVLAHILPKERKVGKVQFVTDFLDALILREQEGADVLHGLLMDEVGSRVAGHFFADGREILGRHAETGSVVSHHAGTGIFRIEAGYELPEERFGGRVARGLKRAAALQNVVELIHEEREQAVDDGTLMLRAGAFKLGLQKVVILTEEVDLLGLQMQDGIVLEKLHHVPCGQRVVAALLQKFG